MKLQDAGQQTNGMSRVNHQARGLDHEQDALKPVALAPWRSDLADVFENAFNEMMAKTPAARELQDHHAAHNDSRRWSYSCLAGSIGYWN
jgi:hypothetical protein